MDEVADALASVDLVELGWCAAGEWVWERPASGAVWPVSVVVAHELAQHGCGVPLVDDQEAVEQFAARTVSTKRSAIAFARGARASVLTIRRTDNPAY